MSARLTGSKVDIAAACAAAFALPAVFEPAGPDAAAGTGGHALLADALFGVADAREKATEALGGDPFAYLPEGIHQPERAYAYDPIRDTARALPTDGHREYPALGSDEIPMTLDVVTRSDLTVGASATITDWKLGQEYVGAESWQLTTAALAVSRAHGLGATDVRIVQRQPSGAPAVRTRSLDAIDLGAAAGSLRRIWLRVLDARATVEAGRTPDVTTGEHCRYCPARIACPANARALRTIARPDIEPASIAALVAAMTPEEAGAAYEMTKRAEAAVDAAKKALEAYAQREPLVLGDGRRVELITVNAERQEMAPTGKKIPYSYEKLQVKGRKKVAA